MSRIVAVGLLALVGLTTPQWCFSQTRPIQSRDRRLDEALVDITLLKRLVKDQDRRIADLEKELKSLQTAPVAIPERPATGDRAVSVVKPPAARWQNPLAWSLIKAGMSRAQVEDILGKPATVESVIDYQTLVYKTDPATGSGLSGTVKLTDDRVSQVNPPGF